MTQHLEIKTKLDLDKLVAEANIAKLLSEEELQSIGEFCWDGYDTDRKSRKEYDLLLDKWIKLAIQISEMKTYPWPKCANIKYPLLATACIQFAARAYPSLVPSNGQIVKVKTVGADKDGEKHERGVRVGKYMSWQLMDEMEEWEEEHDRLLTTLPVVGTMFKKTYWDSMKERFVSCVVSPRELIVNYWAQSLDSVERITQINWMSMRKIKEKMRSKMYREVELEEPVIHRGDERQGLSSINPSGMEQPSKPDTTTPYIVLEQCCFLDLDGDGYEEPYIVTFDEQTKAVFRIAPRYTEQDIIMDEEGVVIYITPQQYYTKYGFVPNPDGGFYDIGFGRLLGTINEGTDTLINQLIDAGSMSNLQAGFLAKGLRMKQGEVRFIPGEWKTVNATGQDLKQGIFPLPVREPSAVLMNLITFLVSSGKELASVAEIFTGKMPGQNTPATTTQASIEQGMKVFTAIYKRIFRAMSKEFKKLYRLNKVYMNPETYVEVLDMEVKDDDFSFADHNIVPAADPNAVSAQEKQIKIRAVMEILQLGTIDPMWATQMYLDAFEIPNAEQAIRQPPPPQPDPKVLAEREKTAASVQGEKEKSQIRLAEAAQKNKLEEARSVRKIQSDSILGDLKVRIAAKDAAINQATTEAKNAQQLRHAEEKHRVMVRQQAAKKKAAGSKKK